MGKVVQNKKKKLQYIIAGIIAFCIFALWVTLPLVNNSPWDSAVANPYAMSKKSADLALLDSAGADAPGNPLTGALIDNPATNLSLEASSLFKMPESELKYEEETKSEENVTSADSQVSVPNVNVHGAGGGDFSPKGKLAKLPSLTAGNSGTMTIGTTHNKFFGQETGKAELVPLKDEKNFNTGGKQNFALSALQKAEKQSLAALNAKQPDQQRGAATSAFEQTKKADESFLNTKDEQAQREAGLELSKIESDLKRNDPSISKKKISLPSPQKDEDESKKMEEEIKKMLLQMIIQATVGQIFGALGQMMAMQICPECYGKKPS